MGFRAVRVKGQGFWGVKGFRVSGLQFLRYTLPESQKGL